MNIVANLITSNSENHETEENNNTLDSNVDVKKYKINKTVESFDSRFVRIINSLKEIHKLKNPAGEFTLQYLIELFDRDIPDHNESLLIDKINKIGFEKLRDTFEKLNMECEDYFCESEDLFGILKRHQFSRKTLKNDSEKLKQVIKYVHVTLIHVNILNKKCIPCPPNLINTKKITLSTIEPLVKEVEIILRNLLNQHK